MKTTQMNISIAKENEIIKIEWDDISLDLSYAGDINFTDFAEELVAYYDHDTKITLDIKGDDDPKLSLVLDSIDEIIKEFNKQFEALDEEAQ